MNRSSRVALLSAVLLTSSYVLSSENNTPAPAVQQGMLAKFAVPFTAIEAGVVSVVDFAATPINKLVTLITANQYLQDTRFGNPDNIKIFGRVAVLGLTVAALYKLHEMYNASQDADDEIIFEDEYQDAN